MNARGFTLLELVAILVIVAVLAVTATARFVGGDALDTHGARDELASAFRLAQRYAVTSGCWTRVTVTANGYSVEVENTPCDGTGFGSIIASPGGDGTLSNNFSGITLSPIGNHVYNAHGDLDSGGGGITLTAGSDSSGFTVQAGSGFVDLP